MEQARRGASKYVLQRARVKLGNRESALKYPVVRVRSATGVLVSPRGRYVLGTAGIVGSNSSQALNDCSSLSRTGRDRSSRLPIAR